MDSNVKAGEKNGPPDKHVVKKKILVIDDEPDMIEMLKDWLVETGYEVDSAPDGIAAIRKTHQFRPDLIILDMMLPGGNGLSVLKRIKLSVNTRNIPVIVLTGSSDPAYKVQALKAGANAYFGKPFNSDALLAEIQKLAPVRTAP